MISLEQARALDAADPLRPFRDRFALPEGVIYLVGNSLGALPRATAAVMRDAVERQWGERLVRSWNEADWTNAPRRVGAKIARLIGAGEDEVIVADSTSVNLFKLVMAAGGAARGGAILAESDNFPTDAYVAERAAELLGHEFRAAPIADVAASFTPDVAVALVTHVDYRSAARHDMAALTAAARANGTLLIWDLSHSVGAVPLDLARDRVELAVGCGYKYLNGGPGAPSFLYVARALQERLRTPIAGWWAHAEPFAFGPDYRDAPGIERFATGTPPMLGLLALEAGVDVMLAAHPALLWDKAVRLHDLLAGRIGELGPDMRIVSPGDPERRGSHLALQHPEALRIVRALAEHGVLADFRAPDIARFALTPLYLGYEDIWRAGEALAAVLAGNEWRAERFSRGGPVT